MRRSLWLALATVAMAASSFAFPLLNTRPQTVGAPAAGEASLQSILDGIYGPGQVNAFTGQTPYGLFGLSTPGSTSVNPQLIVEWAGNANANSVGFFSVDSAGNVTGMADIFPGAAGAGWTALIKWLSPTSGKITLFDAASNIVGQTNFSNIDRNAFGFYLSGPGTSSGTGGKFWTLDYLNPGGAAQAYSYLGGTSSKSAGAWTFAFEDLPINANCRVGCGDGDHNDFVFEVESLQGVVPEPASVVLLGSFLTGAAILVRRRMKA